MTNLQFNNNALDLQGNLSVPGLSGLNFAVQGADYVEIDSAGIQLTGLDADLPSETFSQDGLTFALQNGQVHYNTQTSEFDINGMASVNLAGNTIGLQLGTQQSPGLVITNGGLQSLNATVTTPDFTIGGVEFQSSQLSFSYDSASDEFSITGGCSFTFDGNTVSIQLGGGNTAGLVIDNGNLLSLDASISSSEIDFGNTAKLDNPNLSLHYQQNPEEFTLTGRAEFQLPGADKEVDVQLGSDDTQGIVIQNGQLTDFDLAISTNSSFDIAGLTFDPKNLHITYTTTTDTNNVTHQTFTVTGDVAISAGNTIKDIEVELGDDSTRTDGLVITDGVLESLDASVTANISVAGLTIQATDLTVQYDRSQDDFSLFGSVSVTLAGDTFSADLGDAQDPGIVIVNGALQSLNITGINGNLNLFSVDVEAENLSIQYDAAMSQLELSGGVGIYLSGDPTSGGIGGDAELSQGGLIINTQTGALSINATNGLHLHLDVSLSTFSIKDLDICYSMNADGAINLSASGTIDFGQYAVGGSFQIVDGQLKEIGISFDRNPGIEIGNTGLFITQLSGTIDNLNDVNNLVIDLSITVVEGKKINVNGTDYALLSATGTITITPTSLEIAATDVEVGGGFLGTGTGDVKFAWNSDGSFNALTANVDLQVYNDIAEYKGDISIDAAGNFTVDATLSVNLPAATPGFIKEAIEAFTGGSDTLGSAQLHLQVRPDEDVSQNYVSASLLVGGTPIIGLEVDFAGDVTLIGGGAAAVTAALQQIGETAQEVGQVLKDSFNQTVEQTAQLLQESGYAIDQVGSALQSAFNQTAQETAQVLNQIGATAQQVAQTLQSVYNQTVQETAQLLQETGYAVNQIGSALQSVYNQTAQQAAQVLYNAGYAIDQISSALQSAFQQTAQQAAQVLQNVTYTLSYVSNGVTYVYAEAAYYTNQIASTLKDIYQQTAQQTAQILQGLTFTITGWANGVVNYTYSYLTSSVYSIGSALQTIYNQTAQQVTQIFEAIGTTASNVAQTVSWLYNQSVQQTAQLLYNAGYAIDQISSALQSDFQQTAQQAAQVLQNVTATYSYVWDGITYTYNEAVYTTNQIASTLKDVYQQTAQQAAQILQGLTCTLGEWANGAVLYTYSYLTSSFYSIGSALQSVYSQTAQETAQVLYQVGYAIDQISSTLQNVFQQTAQQTAQVLQNVTYTLSYVSGDLTVLYTEAAYTASQIGSTLKDVYQQTAQQTVQILENLTFTTSEWVNGTLEYSYTYLANNVYSIGSALQSAFNQTAQQAAQILYNANYAINQIGLALQYAYAQTAQQAAQVLQNVTNTYSYVISGVTYTYTEAAYTVNQIASVLQSDFQLQAQQAAQILQGLTTVFTEWVNGVCTYSETYAANSAYAIASALQSVYQQTATQIVSILNGLGVNATTIGYALADLGYAEQTVASALQTVASEVESAAQAAAAALDQVANTIASWF